MLNIKNFTPNNGKINFTARDRPESKLFYEFIAVTKDGSEPLRVKVYQTATCWRACVWADVRGLGYSIGKASHNFRHYDKGMMKAVKDALTSCGFDFESDINGSSQDVYIAKDIVSRFTSHILQKAWEASDKNVNNLDKFVVLTVVAAHG